MTTNRGSCGGCKFSCPPEHTSSDFVEKRVECHRRPPTNGGGFGLFPLMRDNAWCGEFEAKPSEKAEAE